MPLTVQEAAQLGEQKLNIDRHMFAKCCEIAREMEVLPKHMGPMALALGIMGMAKAQDPKELESELTDALSLVAKAESEWRMEQMVGRGMA